MVKACPIFDEVAKLGKSTQDTYNWGGWLILYALLKNGVAKGVASDSHDTNLHLREIAFNKTAVIQMRCYFEQPRGLPFCNLQNWLKTDNI